MGHLEQPEQMEHRVPLEQPELPEPQALHLLFPEQPEQPELYLQCPDLQALQAPQALRLLFPDLQAPQALRLLFPDLQARPGHLDPELREPLAQLDWAPLVLLV